MLNVKTDNTETIETFTDLKKTISNDNEDQEIPPAIEDIIEQLIEGLRDKAITIRYANDFFFFHSNISICKLRLHRIKLNYNVWTYFTLFVRI